MGVCVNRVQGAIPSVHVTFAVVLVATALAEGLENRRAFRVFGAVIRHQDFDFADHVLIDIGHLAAGVTRIDQVGAVQHE